ncbi:Clock-controlled protein 8 [Colletotrichum gloeosporioides]|uniref:Clock-controlled protein 8 n=1 Tax=Colletotrichum gloeosporioides TaxID=474922 RepID=A0A8H4FES8_COLGL|nr:Clock-controlled protein 8 [Colletotrichum gloeosporioides]KAF3799235.1 Clock-controlled protein 8 [Colletotrichum gloeosporioides]
MDKSLSQSMSMSMSQNHMLHGPNSGDRQLPPSSSSVPPLPTTHTHNHHHDHHPHTHSRPRPHTTTFSPAATTTSAAGTSSTTAASSPAKPSSSKVKHVLSHARYDPTHLPSQLPSYAPPSYAHAQSHDPNLLRFPDAPTTELAPILPAAKHNDNVGHNLPSLSSVTGPPPPRFAPPPPPPPPPSQSLEAKHRRQQPQPQQPPPALTRASTTTVPLTHWPSLNPLTTYYTPSHAQPANTTARMDLDLSNNTPMSAASPDRYYDTRERSVLLEDPDVRMAAEALGDLKAGDDHSINSPQPYHTPLPVGSPAISITSNPQASSQTSAEEPLLSLLTTSHPMIANTIKNTAGLYNNGKTFSPRFKTSAEYVEGYMTPITNVAGNISRKTGIETGVRWWLGANRRHQSTDLEAADGGSHKRRKVDTGGDLARHLADSQTNVMPDIDSPRDPYVFKHDRRLSRASTIDTLPAYDDYRSPAYTEDEKAERPNSSNTAWQSRLIMSTSGLSIAMSEESLRSLKYCLSWLRWANGHLGGVINNLKTVLEQYEKAGRSESQGENGDGDHTMTDSDTEAAEHQKRAQLAGQISGLKGDILKTLKNCIETVSKYAGGALPENARLLVHRHLTTLPQRFRYASALEKQQGDKTGAEAQEEAMREGAHRVLVLAKEGLDMMFQVSGVLDGTIVSAEEWCERLGKKKREQPETDSSQPQPFEGDVKSASV